MFSNSLLRTMTATVSCLGLVLPVHVSWAAGQAGTFRQSAATTMPMVVDVRLGAGGVLQGRVVDAQGIGAARMSVLVRQVEGDLAKTETDQHGDFTIRGLRGAVYQVVAGSSARVIRAWAPQTAPPAAHDSVLVVVGQEVVLGQRHAGLAGHIWVCAKNALTNPLVVAGIVALAVGIPAIANNRDKDSGS